MNRLANPLEYPKFVALLELLPASMQGVELVETGYEKYIERYGSNSSVNGRIYELLIVEALRRVEIGPIYYQAKYIFVPNVEFDILLYHPIWPVVLSCKTSLRERYKQAELEGYVLKQVYRGASVYLVTRDKREGRNVKHKIESRVLVGLDECIITHQDDEDFDTLLLNLADCEFHIAEPVEPLQTGYCIPKQ